VNFQKDLAIILRVVPYEDRHRIVTALTEKQGKVSALARNAVQSRRFGGCLDLFAASEWSIRSKPGAELLQLEEAVIRRGFERIRGRLETLTAASALVELVNKALPAQQPVPDVFKLLSNALVTLEELPEERSTLPLLNLFIGKLLHLAGHRPRLESCLKCGYTLTDCVQRQDSTLRAHLEHAGWLCTVCSGAGGTLSPLALLRLVRLIPLPIRAAAEPMDLAEEEERELLRFLEGLMVFHVPGFDRSPIKSLRLIESRLPPLADPAQ
jgi:DNA repair protein RecO